MSLLVRFLKSRLFREAAALLGLAVLPAFVSGAIQLQPNRPPSPQMTPAEVLAAPQEIVWVDARPAPEFAAKHVAKAVPLTLEEWDQLLPPFLDAWHPDKLVVVYGEGASEVAERIRQEMQVKNVRVLKGDWQRWSEK